MNIKQAMEIFKGNVVYSSHPESHGPMDILSDPPKNIIHTDPKGVEYIWVEFFNSRKGHKEVMSSKFLYFTPYQKG